VSGMALIWAANVKGLKPAAKIVLIQLADFHNKETGQCNPSAQRLADECEMGRATLFRHMTTLEEYGLVTRHARGDGKGGRESNQYELHLDITLGPSARPKGEGSGHNGVSSQNETGGNVSKKRGKSLKGETGVVSKRDRNLTIEPKNEPPSRERVAGTDEDAKRILAAYPLDRLRANSECLCRIRTALDEGVDAETLLQAVQAYATESAGFTRSKVCFSDNWFKSGRWRMYLDAIDAERKSAKAKEAEMLDRLAAWVTECHPMCQHITQHQVNALLAAKMVTEEQLRGAGLLKCD